MDQEELNFKQASQHCLSYLERFSETTYASVLLYKDGKLIKIESNQYNNWNVVFFDKKFHEDCVLMNIAEQVAELNEEKVNTIIWDDVIKDEKSKEINELRQKHNLWHGISLISCLGNSYAVVISVCADNAALPDVFHGKIMFSRQNIVDTFTKRLRHV